MYVITVPFIDRPQIHRIWLRHFSKLDLPRKECLVLWYDISGSKLVERQLTDWMNKHKEEFHAFRYIKESQEFIKDYNGGHAKRKTIANTFKRLDVLKKELLKDYGVEADRVIIEDDILFEPDTFTKLRNLAYFNENIWMTTGVNYPRREIDTLIMWREFREEDYKNSIELTIPRRNIMVPVKKTEEKEIGYDVIHATAVGFVFIKKEMEVDYEPDYLTMLNDAEGRSMISGQDTHRGWYISVIKKKLVMVDWSCKYLHVDDEYPFKFWRTHLCKTKPLLEDDDEIFAMASHITSNVSLHEIRMLWQLASNLKNNTIIELGTHCGKTACILADAVKDRGIVLAVDRYGKSKGWMGDSGKVYEDTLTEAKQNAEQLGIKNIIFLKGEFKDIQPVIHTKAGLIFIDGAHTKEGVTSNVEFAMENIDKEGIIAFHDYGNPAWQEVQDTVDQLRVKYGFKMIGHVGSCAAFVVSPPEESSVN